MNEFPILAFAVSLGLAAPSAVAQTESPTREGVSSARVSSEPAQASTDLATVNKKLVASVEQTRRLQRAEIDTKGIERGMQRRIDEMRRFCSNRYARC